MQLQIKVTLKVRDFGKTQDTKYLFMSQKSGGLFHPTYFLMIRIIMSMMLKRICITILIAFILSPASLVFAENYDFVVALDNSGNFTSIQEAIDACKAFPDSRVSIFVKKGTYHEKVVVPSCNTQLSIIGESAEKTIITYNDYFDKINRGRNSTFYTYTFKVEADDFRMENITVENSAGSVGQAVALHIEGDCCVFMNCRFLGNQDTLYAAGRFSRQYFLNCYIEGTTDFIFGEATALFENCKIHCKNDSYITAASTVEGKPFGFVFRDCQITSADRVLKVYLGRPWRSFARVAFLECELGSFICPEGWDNWSNIENEKTAFFAEYKNTGIGAELQNRVSWSHQLTKEQVENYTPENILGDWILKFK